MSFGAGGTPPSLSSSLGMAAAALDNAPSASTGIINTVEQRSLRVYFLNIGMGDCTIVVPPIGGKALLIDAGWTTPPEHRLGESCERVTSEEFAHHIAFALFHLGVHRLRIVLTHGDRDHHSLFNQLEPCLAYVATVTRVYSPRHRKAASQVERFDRPHPGVVPSKDEDEWSVSESEGDSTPDTGGKRAIRASGDSTSSAKKRREFARDDDDDPLEPAEKAVEREEIAGLRVPTAPPAEFLEEYERWKTQHGTMFEHAPRPVFPADTRASGQYKRKILFCTSMTLQNVWGMQAHWLAADVGASRDGPDQRTYTITRSAEDNSVSLCMELMYGPASVILMGDAVGVTEAAAAKHLYKVTKSGDQREGLTTILKLSHHGSESYASNHSAWISAARPRCAIASAARCGHGLPRKVVFDRCRGGHPSSGSSGWALAPVAAHPLTYFTGGGHPPPEETEASCTDALFSTVSTGTLVAKVRLDGRVFVMWEKGSGCAIWHDITLT